MIFRTCFAVFIALVFAQCVCASQPRGLRDDLEKEKLSGKKRLPISEKPETSNTVKKHKKSDKPIFSIDELLDHSVLVHVTNHFPKNGIMIAGGLIDDNIIPKKVAMPARPTLHFAWNKPVGKNFHTAEDNFKGKYYIFEPLREAQDQWYGGYTEDLILVGDYMLSAHSSILVPKDEFDDLKGKNPSYSGGLVPYDNPLEEMGKLLLEKYKAWKVETKFDVDDVKEGRWPVSVTDHKGKIQKKNAQEVFRPLFSNRFWGLHSDSWVGRVDKILTHLNISFIGAFRQMSSRTSMACENYLHKDWQELKRSIILFDYAYTKLLKEVKNFSPKIRKNLLDWREELKGWFNLVRKETELRKASKSIFLETKILKRLIKNREDQKAIEQICMEEEKRLYHERISSTEVCEPRTAFYKIALSMTRDEVLSMIQYLREKNFILGEGTLLDIDIMGMRREKWKTAPVTEEDLGPLITDKLKQQRTEERHEQKRLDNLDVNDLPLELREVIERFRS